MSIDAGGLPIAPGLAVRARGGGGERTTAIVGRTPPAALWHAAGLFAPLAIATLTAFALFYRSQVGALLAASPVAERLPDLAISAQLADIRLSIGAICAAVLLVLAATSLVIARQSASQRDADTEIARLRQRLDRDNESLSFLKSEIETFSYSVSHDLRTPLRAIDGFSKALLDDYSERLDEAGREHLARARRAAQRMGELIDDLVNLSQVGRKALNISDAVSLSGIATAIAADLKRLEPERDVEFIIAPDIAARCDAQLITIAIENLLGNAWKFTRDRSPGVIEFGRTDVEGTAAFFVGDNGAGFDMDHADKLFVPFQRLHPGQEFPGKGIGLATVERIVKKHGGSVWADSAPGCGAMIHFTL